MNKILTYLNTPLIKNTLKLSTSSILMYILPIFVTPILSRIYNPDSFGEWGVFSSMLTIFNIVIFLGYENALIKSTDKDEIVNLSFLCFLILTITTTILGLVFIIGKNFGFSFFVDFPEKRLFFLCLPIFGVHTLLFNIGNWKEKYLILSISSVVLGLSQALFRIIFGEIDITFNGLILGTLFAQLVTVIFMSFFLVPLRFSKSEISTSFSLIKKCAIRYKKFPLYDAPAYLLSFSAFNLPVVILSLFFSKAQIGCYSIILQLLMMPMSFVGSAMSRVYYKQIALAGSGRLDTIQNSTLSVLKIVAPIAVLPMLFLSVGGDKLIVLFLGEKWLDSGNIALCLALWSFPTLLTQPLLPLYRVLNKQNTLLKYNVMYFIMSISSIVLGTYLLSDLYSVLLVYAISCSIVKFRLFKSIFDESRLKISQINTYVLGLWAISILCLMIRFIYLF